MARPQKKGLEYFPLNTDISHNRKVALVESEFGLKGFALVVKLFCEIYRDKGYYMEWNEESQLLVAKTFGEPGSLVGEIVSGCLKRGIFDETVFKMFQVLTSRSIQETYLTSCSRRDRVEIEEAICLVSINGYKNSVNVNINFQNVDTGTQSKVEYSKVKESKVEYGDKSPALEDRKNAFMNSLVCYVEEFSKKTVREFFDYWSESNDNGKKMRWEMEKVFDRKKRLITWQAREKEFSKSEVKSKVGEISKTVVGVTEELKQKYAHE